MRKESSPAISMRSAVSQSRRAISRFSKGDVLDSIVSEGLGPGEKSGVPSEEFLPWACRTDGADIEVHSLWTIVRRTDDGSESIPAVPADEMRIRVGDDGATSDFLGGL